MKSQIRKLIPPFLLRTYHYLLALAGVVFYGFSSRKLTVIGVTGTSGKSTTVDFISRIFTEADYKTASLSSVRFKIGDQEWKNNRKMTMPGRFFIQKFLRQAVRASCKYAVLEVTSEGIAQFRHKFITFDAAVFTNLTPEHLESHGGFENYRNEKLKLFRACKNIHVVNAEDQNAEYFLKIPAKRTITFGLEKGDLNLKNTPIHLNILGNFNYLNALGAAAIAGAYNIPLKTTQAASAKVQGIPGRMEAVAKEPFLVVVDYAHTPEQLEKAYQSLKGKNLICVLGSCGGGRDKWKRPVLGKIASQYCKEIIITNEDPYDEDPMEIINQVAATTSAKAIKILDRREAIHRALQKATPDDVVIITGKGSEPWMCIENGKKIPWDDREVTREEIKKIAPPQPNLLTTFI